MECIFSISITTPVQIQMYKQLVIDQVDTEDISQEQDRFGLIVTPETYNNGLVNMRVYLLDE